MVLSTEVLEQLKTEHREDILAGKMTKYELDDCVVRFRVYVGTTIETAIEPIQFPTSQVILGGRGTGKTKALVEEISKEDPYNTLIICANEKRKDIIIEYLKIHDRENSPYKIAGRGISLKTWRVMTIADLLHYRQVGFRKDTRVFIDDFQEVLSAMLLRLNIPRDIVGVTLDIADEELQQIQPNLYKTRIQI